MPGRQAYFRLILVIVMAAVLAGLCLARVSASGPTATRTAVPTATFYLNTLSPAGLTQVVTDFGTALPTPTITPTLGKLITHTPAAPSPCPAATNPSREPTLDGSIDENDPYGPEIVEYLNAGGTIARLSYAMLHLTAESSTFGNQLVWQADVTGNGVPDVVAGVKVPGWTASYLYVFSCRSGKYVTLYVQRVQDQVGNAAPLAVQDMNGDGTAEIVYGYQPIAGVRASGPYFYMILEWNGTAFVDVVPPGNPQSNFPFDGINGGKARFRAVRPHGNGTYDLVLLEASPKDSYYGGSITGRAREDFWAWNGALFTYFCSRAAEPAVYRVHAVEDGDDETRCGHYPQAAAAYQRSIFDNNLLGWTDADSMREPPTPSPSSPDERAILGAYARYRIVLLHLVQNQLKEAETDNTILQQMYPTGAAGHPYAELARLLWEGFNAQHSVGAACQRVVDYAYARSEIIFPLLRYQYNDGTEGRPAFPLYYPGTGPIDTFDRHGDVSALCPFR